jgi:transposase-like protein
MSQLNKINRQFTEEFKKESVRLADRLGNASAAAEKLGIGTSTIHAWKAKHPEWALKPDQQKGDAAAELAALKEENRRLKRELSDSEDAVYILKRAAVFFSQDRRKPNLSS